MANSKHLDKLCEGVLTWNTWRQENPSIKPDLSKVWLFQEILKRRLSNGFVRISYYLSPLFGIIFLLLSFNLENIANKFPGFFKSLGYFLDQYPLPMTLIFIFVISFAIRYLLMRVNIWLAMFTIRELFRTFDLINTSLDFTEINLDHADLSDTIFTGLDTSRATFRRANLTNSNFTRVKALYADFEQAQLSGACLEDWQHDHAKFDNIQCDFIYLKNGKKDRYPPSRNFESGEFTKIFQEVENTIELIFRDGTDWKAFAFTFDKTSTEIYNESGQKLSLIDQDILDDGSIRLKVLVPPDIDAEKARAKLEGSIESLKYSLSIFKPGNHFYGTTEKVQLGDSNTMTGEAYNNYGQSGAMGKYARSDNNTFIQSEQKQTLAEAAAEIQRLLKQLEQTNPNVTEAEKVAYVNDETSPSFKRRAGGALQAFGETAIEEFLDNPYINVVKAVVKGWIKPE